jgi:hypothetical protein
VVGFTIGSRGKVPGKTCEKRIRKNKNIRIVFCRLEKLYGAFYIMFNALVLS